MQISCTRNVSTLHYRSQGFTVNGKVDDADESSSYASKCVYVQGLGEESTVTYDGVEVKTGLIGFSMDGMEIKNCG